MLLGNNNGETQTIAGVGTVTAPASTPNIFDPATGGWAATAPKNDVPAEETWTLLPDGGVLTVQCSTPPGVEIFNGTAWVFDTSTANYTTGTGVTLPQGGEIGPAILLPDGRVFAIGGDIATALYTPSLPGNFTTSGAPASWAVGPTLQDAESNLLFGADTPACLLPNGRVLCCATLNFISRPPGNVVHFFEFDPTTENLDPAPSPANIGTRADTGRMLLLPSGQVLFSNNTNDIEVYTPDPGGWQEGWRPAIISAPARIVPGFTYRLAGTQFNGLSQAVSYGDDAQAATNYPIVILRNLVGAPAMRFGRTFGHSTMAVATGDEQVETWATIPWEMEEGAAQLTIIANGIPSNVFTLTVAHVRSLRRWMVANGKNPQAPLLPQLPAAGVRLATLLPP